MNSHFARASALITAAPKKRRPIKRNFTPMEHEEQVNLIQWAAHAACKYPPLRLLYAIPNGGNRHPVTAAKLKAEGVRAGVPDLCLPVPRGTYAGLYVELKRKQGGSVSEGQREWIHLLTLQGYRVEVCKGWEAARDVIVAYLESQP